jgi:hypothetical protein
MLLTVQKVGAGGRQFPMLHYCSGGRVGLPAYPPLR